jgi:cytochrome P450
MSQCPIQNLPAPFDPGFFADPYPTYAKMHETGPVQRIVLPEGMPVWLVTRYADAALALKDQRLVRNRRYAGADYDNELLPEICRSGNLHMEDGPVHARLRRFMNFAFVPSRIAAMVPRIQEITDQLLDQIERDGGGDIMDGVAAPLPIAMTSDILGVPKDMRGNFREWSDAMLGGDPGSEGARDGARALLGFVMGLIEAKKTEPADDLISYWLSAVDNDDEPLTDQEMIGMTFFLLLGGYDTTVGQIGASVLALINNPDKADRIRSHPESTATAVEELMRWDGSTHSGIRRFAIEDMTIAGVEVAKGDVVVVSLGAANRDPERFESPEILDFDRPDVEQLGFGRGPHICPGKELARAELRICLSEIARRFPSISLADPDEEIVWRPSYLIRVPRQLKVTV